MFISNLWSLERRGNHCLTTKCRFKTPQIHQRCYVMSSKSVRVPFLFPLFLADLDKKYRKEIEMNKK